MRRAMWLTALFCGLLVAGPAASEGIRVGSKKFTESVILGELAAQLAEQAGVEVEHRRELGGTRVLWNALLQGSIDVYPEYTGTLRQEIFAGQPLASDADLTGVLAPMGLQMSAPLGFNNTYVLGMQRERAEALGLQKLSELVTHPELRFGFSNEFMDRGDGWPSLRQRYALPQQDVRGLDHDLAYRGLESGALDVIDLYSTDAEIRYYDLAVLQDDLGHFPRYDAVWLMRRDLAERFPQVAEALSQFPGSITAEQMVALNAGAKLDKRSERCVAAQFLSQLLQVDTQAHSECLGTPVGNMLADVWNWTGQHLSLVVKSLLPAILVAVPLGIAAARRPRFAQIILGAVGVVQTIPALALLVLLMSLLTPLRPLGIETIGDPPAIVALFLYSLLPMVRNTYAGLHDIAPPLRESAEALGLPERARLWRIELPLASRTILAGIKTAAVINIGFATLGALIGAGGYGQPILTGIRLDDTALILQGALPAALMALLAQALFELAERGLVPKGLRLRSHA